MVVLVLVSQHGCKAPPADVTDQAVGFSYFQGSAGSPQYVGVVLLPLLNETHHHDAEEGFPAGTGRANPLGWSVRGCGTRPHELDGLPPALQATHGSG